MLVTNQIVKKSNVPVLIIGVVWIFWALIFPLYLWHHFLIVGATSFLAYLLCTLFFKPKAIALTWEDRELERTGDEAVDTLLSEGEKFIRELSRMGNTIQDKKMKAELSMLIITCEKLFTTITEHRNLAGQLKRFSSYYMPTTQKLAQTFRNTERNGGLGENAAHIKTNILDAMHMINDAFTQQLDSLYGNVDLDISTEVEVLDTMLKKSGLTK